MFICEITKKVSKPGEKQHKIVLESRKKDYYNEKGEKVGEGNRKVFWTMASTTGLDSR